MLLIRPIQDKDFQSALCVACGVTYRPADLAYAAYLDEKPIAVSQFTLRDEYGMLDDIATANGTSDNEALFILARQTMNWIDLRGIHTCRARTGACSPRLLEILGFSKLPDGTYEADMTSMFNGHCGGNCHIAEELQKL